MVNDKAYKKLEERQELNEPHVTHGSFSRKPIERVVRPDTSRSCVDRASRQLRRRNLILQRPIFSWNLFQQRRAPGHRTSILPMRYLHRRPNSRASTLFLPLLLSTMYILLLFLLYTSMRIVVTYTIKVESLAILFKIKERMENLESWFS